MAPHAEQIVMLRLGLGLVLLMGIWGEAAAGSKTPIYCNVEQYTGVDPAQPDFGQSVDLITADLINNTPFAAGRDYPNHAYGLWGHATCPASISEASCASCLGILKAAITTTCSLSVGAHATYNDCYMRYEIYPF